MYTISVMILVPGEQQIRAGTEERVRTHSQSA